MLLLKLRYRTLLGLPSCKQFRQLTQCYFSLKAHKKSFLFLWHQPNYHLEQLTLGTPQLTFVKIFCSTLEAPYPGHTCDHSLCEVCLMQQGPATRQDPKQVLISATFCPSKDEEGAAGMKRNISSKRILKWTGLKMQDHNQNRGLLLLLLAQFQTDPHLIYPIGIALTTKI